MGVHFVRDYPQHSRADSCDLCSIKGGIMQSMVERLSTFRTEMVALADARSLTLREFCVCGALEFFGKKAPFAIRCWLSDMRNAFRSSLCLGEAKVKLASYLL